VRIAIDAIAAAPTLDLSWLVERVPDEGQKEFVRRWPGEHYRLLRSLVSNLSPALTVEVGTLTGMGTLALTGAGRVITYDIVPWDALPNTALVQDDFKLVEQRLGDLADPGFFGAEREILGAADLIFVDAPKDGEFEPAFLSLLLPAMKPGCLLVLDDIRFATMTQLWDELPLPKMDLTAFGHVSGTGLALKS
jgi:predicted O-methyltransferase YrrM